MDDFWLYVLKGILLLVLIVSSKARSVGLFLFGLIGMILIFVGIFEHGDYMSDLSIFEILFFIGLMFFMRRPDGTSLQLTLFCTCFFCEKK